MASVETKAVTPPPVMTYTLVLNEKEAQDLYNVVNSVHGPRDTESIHEIWAVLHDAGVRDSVMGGRIG